MGVQQGERSGPCCTHNTRLVLWITPLKQVWKDYSTLSIRSAVDTTLPALRLRCVCRYCRDFVVWSAVDTILTALRLRCVCRYSFDFVVFCRIFSILVKMDT